MKLLTKAIIETMPPLYATEDVPVERKIVRVKFFLTGTSWTWYAVEASVDHEDGLKPLSEWNGVDEVRFFGLVDGFDAEWGYFSLWELQSLRAPVLGLPIERDLHLPAGFTGADAARRSEILRGRDAADPTVS